MWGVDSPTIIFRDCIHAADDEVTDHIEEDGEEEHWNRVPSEELHIEVDGTYFEDQTW